MNLSWNYLTSLKILVIYIQICVNQHRAFKLLFTLYCRSSLCAFFRVYFWATGMLDERWCLIFYTITTILIIHIKVFL